ncbi:MAG: PspC domain-containing protein [Cytophagales bacterium]|nr:PspC domain-containing protein [Cytophagales bacterium]
MKKTVTINISGTIFNIEEDGYEKLNDYLTLINKHFSSYDDKEEIVEDIESRIAELFLDVLGKSKQVITLKDVEKLISRMGDIADFEAIEEDQKGPEKADQKEKEKESEEEKHPKKLFRDGKRKILGGVAAGIAHYFKADPIWIRLAFLVLTPFWGIMILIYIILWIILPESDKLEDDKKIKKLFRDPDKRIIGGVSSGIATYFGTDDSLIRLLFVVAVLFGGTGIIAYIVLWIITPEAKTITEKMEMQGEPVTLSNIESNIKKGLNVEDKDGEEGLLAKIVLFPFRLLAQIFNWLEKNIGSMMVFLVEIIRIFSGVFLILISSILLLSLLIVFGISMGLFTFFSWMVLYDLPLDILHGSIPFISSVSGFLTLFIPAVFLGLLGIIFLAKRNVINPLFGWTMVCVWFLSIIGLGISVPLIAKNFRTEAYYKTSQSFDIEDGRSLYITAKEAGNETYKETTLKIRGHDEPYIKLVQKFESRGINRKNAINNVKMLTYNVVFKDSILTFDTNFDFTDSAKFRFQTLEMVLYLPYKQTFLMDKELKKILRSTIHKYRYSNRQIESNKWGFKKVRSIIYKYGYSNSQIEGNKWHFTKDGLECLTCKPLTVNEDDIKIIDDENGKYSREYQLTGFTKLNIGSAFIIDVKKGKDFKVVITGEDDNDMEEVTVKVDGDELEIDYEHDLFEKYINRHNFNFGVDRNNMEVSVTMPEISGVYFYGASISSIRGFNTEDFHIELSGASQSKIDIMTKKLEIEMSGASELTLSGSGNELDAEISGASELKAYKFKVKNAWLQASGASDVRAYVTEKVTIETSGMSDVKFKGNPKVVERRR